MTVIDLDAHRPHRTVHVVCGGCGESYLSVAPVGVDVSMLEHTCGARASTYCEKPDCQACALLAG